MHPNEQQRAINKEKQRAAASSALAGLFLTAIKLAAGLATGSLGLLAEAAHSALDCGAAAMTLVAVRTSWRPPDAEHHYGHAKIENLTALGEALLLVITSVWILWEAGQRFAGGGPEVEPSVWAFVVMATSIVVDIVRSGDLRRVALASGSQALEADALHFSTDIASSSVVIVGLAGVAVARAYDVPWLAVADPIAASVVAVIVMVLSWRLGRRAVDMLLDRAPTGMMQKVRARLATLDGLEGEPTVKVRQAGDQIFADVEVGLRRGLPLAEAERIAREARRRVMEEAGRLSVVSVQLAARQGRDATLHDRVAIAVEMEGVHAHNITIREDHRGAQADLHLELPAELSLSEGHAIADRVEDRLRQEVPELRRVDIHLELHDVAAEPSAPLPAEDQRALEARVRAVALATCRGCTAGDLLISLTAAGLYVSMHVGLAGDMSLAEAHTQTDRIEQALREAIPNIARVSVHAEPHGGA